MTFNKCNACSESEVPAHADFCISCGQQMERSKEDQTNEEKVIEEPTSKVSIIAWIVIVLLVLGGIGKILEKEGKPQFGKDSEYDKALKLNQELKANLNKPLIPVNINPGNQNNLATADKTTKSPCASIESELASVEYEQAGNEGALDIYEGKESPMFQSAYLNALKEKGRLQLRHIDLERKLKACTKKR